MRELSGEQHTEREGFPDVSAGPEPARDKGWLWHSLAALVVAALGLVVAAAVGLTTDAQTTRDLSAVPDTSVADSSAPIDGAPIQTGRVPGTNKQSKSQHPALAAFGRRETTTSRSSRSGAIRAAIVQEQAAQRDELLAKTADEISRAAEDASSDARQQQLKAADRASGEAAAQIAAENLRRATAARVAAENKRQAAENQPNNPDSGSSTTSSSGDSGSGSGGSDGSSGSGSGGSGGGEAVLPVPGGVIGAHFGEYGMWSRYHTGLDFRAAYGTPIRAVKSGVVLYAGNSGNWAGNHVAIKHADGKTTMYSHLSSMSTRMGQTVQAGQVIGRVGETGRAFGAHLHFELYPAGVKYGDVYKAINPQPWLAANGVTTH
jgi:murein DD-endopeptidase MepM/ murein hydrolase activator NlpD